MRYQVMTAVLEGLRSAARSDSRITDVQIELVWPGELIEAESIWFDSIDGEVTNPIMRGPVSTSNPVVRDDRFDLPIQIKAGKPGQTASEAAARAYEIFEAVDAWIAANPQPSSGVFSAAVRERNGPATGRMGDDFASFVRAVVAVHTREST